MTGDTDAGSRADRPDGPVTRRARHARRAAVSWTLVVVAASLVDPGVLLDLAGTPGADTGGGAGAGWFVAAHLLAYGVLAWLLVDGQTTGARGWRAVVAAVTVAVAVGAGVELLQAPLAARTASATDALVNAVGAAVGAGARATFGPR